MTLLVDPGSVREYLALSDTAATSQYTDGTLSSNIAAAQSSLEQVTGRYLAPRTFTVDNPWLATTQNRQSIALPGFRAITTVTRSGSVLDANGGYWAVPDERQTGVFTRMAFRAATGPDLWPGQPGTPYGPWITNPSWFDQAADSPFAPGNVGGGLYLTSLPNDLAIVGTAGYDPTIADGYPGSPPFAVLHAIKVLASFYTMRPASILADVAITPQGGVLTYSTMPPEVRDFVASWRTGSFMASVG